MKIAVNVPDRLLEFIKGETGLKTGSAAVISALDIYRIQQKEVVRYWGL